MALDAPSDSLLSKIQDRGKLVVGTGSTNPPWHFEDENGDLIGSISKWRRSLPAGSLDLTRIRSWPANRSRRIEFVVHEVRRPDSGSSGRKVDVNFQFMTVTAGRALQAEFTIPYYREGVTILLPADSEFNTWPISKVRD